jgi:hypothetical protein
LEIDEIEQKVLREREKYKQMTQTKPDALTIIPHIEINDKVISFLAQFQTNDESL